MSIKRVDSKDDLSGLTDLLFGLAQQSWRRKEKEQKEGLACPGLALGSLGLLAKASVKESVNP